MSSRTGVLSDEMVNMHCNMHRPIPMNRLDLLIPNLKNISGVYSRKLKEPNVLSRPATAYNMILDLQRLNPKVDIMGKYQEMLNKPAPAIPVVKAPPDALAPELQPVTQQYYIRPNIADLMYLNIADTEGLLANIIEGTSWGGSAFGGTDAVSQMGEAEAQAQRDFILAQLDEMDAQNEMAAMDEIDAVLTEQDVEVPEGLKRLSSAQIREIARKNRMEGSDMPPERHERPDRPDIRKTAREDFGRPSGMN